MVNDSFSLRGFSNLHDYHSNLLDRNYAVYERVINRREFALIVESPKAELSREIFDLLRGRGLNTAVCRIDIDSTASSAISRVTATRKIPVMRTAHLLERRGVLRALRPYVRNFQLNQREEVELLRECVLVFGENLDNPAMFALTIDSNGWGGKVGDALAAVCRDAGVEIFSASPYITWTRLREHLINYVNYI